MKNSILRNEALPLLCLRRNLNFQDSEWQYYSNRIFLCILYDKWYMDPFIYGVKQANLLVSKEQHEDFQKN